MRVKSVRNQNTATQIMIPKLSLYICSSVHADKLDPVHSYSTHTICSEVHILFAFDFHFFDFKSREVLIF